MKIELIGLPGVNITRIINVIKSVYQNLDIEESFVFNEVLLTKPEYLTEDNIKKLVIDRIDNNNLYLIIDDSPDNCIRNLNRQHIQHNLLFDDIDNYKNRFADIYKYCRGNYVDNVKYISAISADYMRTILSEIKLFVKP